MTEPRRDERSDALPYALSDAKATLLLELGRGGMGVVYLVTRHLEEGRRELFVLKRMRADASADETLRAMFVAEARLLARLHHPNVVETIALVREARGDAIEMEYLDGQPLDRIARLAASTRALPRPIALSIVRALLAGLHAVHELRGDDGALLGVVHRDVSPHNVFVTYEGAVKLLDFGVAKAIDGAQTRTGVVKGKATYMAPEQARRAAIDRRADLFAAGIVLVELLTGARFWGDREEVEVLFALQRGELPSLDLVAVAVDATLRSICA
ncbi:MAG: serine/threonine-protein kinase, partial [Polyangiales bacterium]